MDRSVMQIGRIRLVNLGYRSYTTIDVCRSFQLNFDFSFFTLYFLTFLFRVDQVGILSDIVLNKGSVELALNIKLLSISEVHG
jgi:hypothetical protein